MRRFLAYLAVLPPLVAGGIRRALPAFAAVLFLVSLGVGVAACSGKRLIDTDVLAPASVADVKAVQSDVDTLRTDTRAGIDAVRADLSTAKIDTTATGKALDSLDGKIEEAKNRPAPSGVAGALVNAIAGSGVLPGWLDWIVTLGATALGINVARNRTRKPALAKVKTEAVLTATGKVPPAAPPAP